MFCMLVSFNPLLTDQGGDLHKNCIFPPAFVWNPMLTLSNCVSQHRSIHTFDLHLKKCEQATYLGVRVKPLQFIWMSMGSNSKICDSVKILRVKIAFDTNWILKFHKDSTHWFQSKLPWLEIFSLPGAFGGLLCSTNLPGAVSLNQKYCTGTLGRHGSTTSGPELGGNWRIRSPRCGSSYSLVMNRCSKNDTFRFYMCF